MLFCHKFLCWEEKEKEFKLQSKVQPNEICALNNVHVRAINMKSHSFSGQVKVQIVPTSGDKLMLD